jgi:DNA ligase (NAD+)
VLNLSKNYLNTDVSDFNLKDVYKLQELIKFHSDLYYNKDEPIISDSDYDNLLKKLTILENKFNIEVKQSSLV